jgi:ABC-type nitrate/sulfonate/bicarbonate transport system substrate-binding protein
MTSQNEIKNNREMIRRTLAALMEAVGWIRANREESARMIATKFKVNQTEAEGTYGTLVKMFSKDGRLSPKVARGYIDLLRQDRPIPADFDLQKVLDFSLLPPAANK